MSGGQCELGIRDGGMGPDNVWRQETGTARRTVSVKTVLNVAQMFTQFHVIGPSPTLGIRRSLAPQLLGPFNYPKDGENRRKTAKDTRRQAKDVLASFVNKRWAMKDDKKTTSSNKTQWCYCKPSALLLQLTVAKY